MSTEKVFQIVFSILLAVNVVGNVLVILVILKRRSMKTPLNFLLVNLAVSDLLVALFFAPRFLLIHLFTHPAGTLGKALCTTLTGMNISWVASLASGFALVWIAVERFYVVIYPTSIERKITKRKLRRIIPGCWVVAIIHTLPSFVANSFDETLKLCREIYTSEWQYVSYWFLWLLGAGVVPVSVMAVLYARVIYALWITNSHDATRIAVINARKRITKKSITVSVVYAVCVLPTHVLYFSSIYYPSLIIDDGIFFKTSYCLLVLNSSINPFVYTFQCGNFRRHLKSLLGCRNTVYPHEYLPPS